MMINQKLLVGLEPRHGTHRAAQSTVVINGGGTINSVKRRGSLSPVKGGEDYIDSPVVCDSSQITQKELDAIFRMLVACLKVHQKVIYMMGTDSVGNVGDALRKKFSHSEHLNGERCIVLTAAMDPQHKNEALRTAHMLTTVGINVVITDSRGKGQSWSLNEVSIRKFGDNVILPFIEGKPGAFDGHDNAIPEYLRRADLELVLPDIHDSIEGICSKIMVAVGDVDVSPDKKRVVLVGRGVFNFPVHAEIIACLNSVKGRCEIVVSTSTQAYFELGPDSFTPYLPLTTLSELGILPFYKGSK